MPTNNFFHFQSDDETFRKLREAFAFINSQFDIFDHYNVNYYLYAHGLAIRRDYRGHGFASELLKARVLLLMFLGLTVTASLFTTLGAQKAAFKVGFTEDFSISYKILQDLFKNFDFSVANCDDCKLLTIEIKLPM